MDAAEKLYQDLCFKPPEQWREVIRDAFEDATVEAKSAPKWTTTPPTVPGWYWWRGSNSDPELRDVILLSRELAEQYGGRLATHTSVGNHLYAVSSFGGEWCGPLEPPT